MTFYQSQRRSFVTCFYVSLFLLLTVHVKVSTASLELLSLPWVYMCLCIYALMMNVPFYMCGCMHKFSCVPTYICTVYLPAEFECALFSKSVYIWSISEVPPLDQQNWQWCVCKAVPGLHFFKGLKVTSHHIYAEPYFSSFSCQIIIPICTGHGQRLQKHRQRPITLTRRLEKPTLKRKLREAVK